MLSSYVDEGSRREYINMADETMDALDIMKVSIETKWQRIWWAVYAVGFNKMFHSLQV